MLCLQAYCVRATGPFVPVWLYFKYLDVSLCRIKNRSLREHCWKVVLINSTCVALHDAILASIRECKAQTSPRHRRSMPCVQYCVRHLIYLEIILFTHARLSLERHAL